MPEQDLLIEIGTEELPPKALQPLISAFQKEVGNGLTKANLAFNGMECFATPRRLGLIVKNLQTKQADLTIEKLGPAVKAAFDAEGQPTKAAEGFARSCGVTISELGEKDDGKVSKLFYSASKEGESASLLIPAIVNDALALLPIPKRMRWGSSRIEFVRPVHWSILLFGSELIPATILGVETQRHTYGHRFHHPDKIELNSPADYNDKLSQQGYVLPSFSERKNKIRELIELEGKKLNARPVIDDALLDEVSALVEWPVALTGSFDQSYLSVPTEALVSSLKVHQKCFYLVDAEEKILPNFITISNLVSQNPDEVIRGNERVIGPRLADAAFFYEQDKKQTLESRRNNLSTVVFQQSLGTLLEKSDRVARLSLSLAKALDTDPLLCERAALLGKCDLLTNMVGEFADLQGIMGYYYGLNDREPEAVALALKEQYLPRFSGDDLPASDSGIVLALAERLDTVVGLFGIGQPPTGSKDPFALRRATLGILRIIVDKNLSLDLVASISLAIDGFTDLPEREGLEKTVLDFIFDRFRALYADQGVDTKIFQAVDAVRPASPLEFNLRVKAVNSFIQLPQAQALASANKRVANILAKLEQEPATTIDESLLIEDAEKALATRLDDLVEELEPLLAQQNFTSALETMATLQKELDPFFDTVLVNADDPAIRGNRQALLQRLRQLFLRIADISLLQNA
jgi:glycyl-tRNA synthetase beta chain